MSKQELLQILKLLSAIEGATTTSLPNYLFEQIDVAVAVLQREILKNE